MATCDARKVMQWSDIIVVVTHAGAHQKIAQLCASHISEPKTVILCPSYVGGGWHLRREINKADPHSQINVVECSVLPFACRKTDRRTVSIHGLKRRFMVSTMGKNDAEETTRLFTDLFEDVIFTQHDLEAGLHETNFIIHSCIALLNIGFVHGDQEWTFYRQGLTKSIGKLIEAVDAERTSLLKKLLLPQISLAQWFIDFYKEQGIKGKSVYKLLSDFSPFAGSPGPRSLLHRYFSEDIAYGLVPMSSLAASLNVRTPLTDSLIELASAICGVDYRTTGRYLGDFKSYDG
jgi:opine dehydrogenase